MWQGLLAAVFVLAVTEAPAAAGDAKQQAAELAAQGAKHYKRGEFEESAKLLREAYAKYPEPNLLYNLARSLEGFGDRQGAIDAYEQYLAAGKQIEDRAGIERRVANLKTELVEQKHRADAATNTAAAPPPPPPIGVAPSQRPAVAVVERPPPAQRSRTLPWLTVAGGVAIAAAGGAFGYLARQHHQTALDAMSGVDAQAWQDRAQGDALVANILFGVGGAVVITGVVLVW